MLDNENANSDPDDRTRRRAMSVASSRAPDLERERGNASFRARRYDEVRDVDAPSRRRRKKNASSHRSSLTDASGRAQAIEAYARAIEGSAGDAATLTNISAAYLELGRYELAEAAARRALEANATWRKGYARLARSLERQGRAKAAMDVYRRGIEQCGPNAQMQERLVALTEAAEREDASPETLKERGNALLRSGDTVAAVCMYTLAIDKNTASNSTLAALYNNRAEARRRLGEHQAAVDDCSKALELEPNNVKALLRRAGTYDALEKYTLASEDYARALTIDPSDPCGVRQRLKRCRILARELCS